MTLWLDRRMLIAGALALGAGVPARAARAPRPRILVSTDIGGTDPDDFQSLVHLLVLADSFDLEGLVSSPFGPGRVADILRVIAEYERDYPNLRRWSPRYPEPDALRALSRQGETETAGYSGVGAPTDGSDWIVRCARRDDPRPLHLLVWGGAEDLAQALHDAPDILPRLRVYFIGGPNKKWSTNAYAYIAAHHPRLWMIESNATYRGWFVGGDQTGEWSNRGFVDRHVAGQGALGDFFATQLEGTIKMGDTPSLAWARGDTPGDPAQDSWGGRYVRAWSRAPAHFDRLPTAADTVEAFATVELALALDVAAGATPQATLAIDNQRLAGDWDGTAMRFRLSPKEARTFDLAFASDHPVLDGQRAAFTAVPLRPGRAPDPRWPNWWTDDPAPAAAEGEHAGARSVSRWRRAYLAEFAERMRRCAAPPRGR